MSSGGEGGDVTLSHEIHPITPLEQLAKALRDADSALQKLVQSIHGVSLPAEIGQHPAADPVSTDAYASGTDKTGMTRHCNSCGCALPADVLSCTKCVDHLSKVSVEILASCTSSGTDASSAHPSNQVGNTSRIEKNSALITYQSERKDEGFVLLPVWTRRRSQLRSEKTFMKKCSVEEPRPSIDDISESRQESIRDSFETHLPPTYLSKVLLHPHGRRRFAWDVSSLILVVYDMFVIPLHFFDLGESAFLNRMNWITRVFWTSDMLVSILSGYMTADGCIEMRPKRICFRYISSWFPLDCCVVGIDWLELILQTAGGLGFARFGKASRVFRILRLLRLLRLARMKEVWNLLCERFDSERLIIVLDAAKLLIAMCAVGHLVGCVFYAVGTMDGQGWVKVYDFTNKSIRYKYIMSLRWAMSQFAGGMDEVTPVNFDESIYAFVMFFSAYWCGAVFLGLLTSSMTEFCLQGTQQRQKLTALRQYLQINGISNKLCVRVNRNAAHAVRMKERTEPDGVADLIQMVSEPLRREIHFEMYTPTLEVHSFFNSYIKACPHVMRKVCHNAVSMSAESLGDVIFNFGEVSDHPCMHIVSRGSLMYSSFTGQETNLTENDWVAEPTLWVAWMYRGSLAVTQDSLLCNVDARKFQTTVLQFEHVDFDPRDYANEFMAMLNATSNEELTDLPARNEAPQPRERHHSISVSRIFLQKSMPLMPMLRVRSTSSTRSVKSVSTVATRMKSISSTKTSGKAVNAPALSRTLFSQATLASSRSRLMDASISGDSRVGSCVSITEQVTGQRTRGRTATGDNLSTHVAEYSSKADVQSKTMAVEDNLLGSAENFRLPSSTSSKDPKGRTRTFTEDTSRWTVAAVPEEAVESPRPVLLL